MCFNLSGEIPSSKQWKIPASQARALKSWFDWASCSSQSFGKMGALCYMKSEVFLALGLCTEEMFVNERELPFVIAHHSWPFPWWHHYLLLLFCPALHTQLFHGHLPCPDSITGPVFMASFQGYVTWLLVCVLVMFSKQLLSSTFTYSTSSSGVQISRKGCSGEKGWNDAVVFLHPCFRRPWKSSMLVI